jgi:hypothetical protein
MMKPKEPYQSTVTEVESFFAEYGFATMSQLSKERQRLWKANTLGVRNRLSCH